MKLDLVDFDKESVDKMNDNTDTTPDRALKKHPVDVLSDGASWRVGLKSKLKHQIKLW